MQTSEQGIAFLERHEGVVLKAYRDPVGVLTIGAGLTKASGVINPKPGMVITRKQATEFLGEALRRNYEPRVRRAMPGADQHEFDGGVSFDFNTGAIDSASWVPHWISRNWPQVEKRLKLWKKGGGKVLPGLVRRRDEEFRLIRDGVYRLVAERGGTGDNFARIVLPMSDDELEALHAALTSLGYAPGDDPIFFEVGAIKRFQQDHDLTVDGVIGKATLSTVQRMVDARSKVKAVGTGTTAGGAGVGVGGAAEALPWSEVLLLGGGVLAIGLICLGYYAWRYRDAIAVKVQNRFPKLAAKLRSF